MSTQKTGEGFRKIAQRYQELFSLGCNVIRKRQLTEFMGVKLRSERSRQVAFRVGSKKRKAKPSLLKEKEDFAEHGRLFVQLYLFRFYQYNLFAPLFFKKHPNIKISLVHFVDKIKNW